MKLTAGFLVNMRQRLFILNKKIQMNKFNKLINCNNPDRSTIAAFPHIL